MLFSVEGMNIYETCAGFFHDKQNMLSRFEQLGNLPIERAKDAVCFLQSGGVSLASSAIIYNIVKVKVTH